MAIFVNLVRIRTKDPYLNLNSGSLSTRWRTTHSFNVNLHHAINLRALCGANSVTLPSKFRRNETLEVHRVDRRLNTNY